ncbi:MAG: 2TM domain-containing protein [bacterium]|nr:2TM domain-containing protein [bacterium]
MSKAMSYEEAKERIQELRGFYSHLLVFVLGNSFLFVVNLLTSRGDWWFYWPLLGWGVGIVAHGSWVFWGRGLWGKSWEERKIRELMGDRAAEDDPTGP